MNKDQTKQLMILLDKFRKTFQERVDHLTLQEKINAYGLLLYHLSNDQKKIRQEKRDEGQGKLLEED